MHARWMPILAAVVATNAWAEEIRKPPIDDLSAGMPTEEDANSWVRMTNGEWLWGEVIGYRNDAVTVDSDQFGVMTIDMADVAAVWNPRSFEWARRGGEVYSGPGVITDGVVRVLDREGGEVTFPLDELDGLAPGATREIDRWSFYVRAGVDGRWGNTEQFSVTTGVGFEREDARTRFTLDQNSAFGTSQKEETVNNHRVDAEFDVFLTRAFYLVVPGATLYVDRFQNLQPRVTTQVGVGVRLEPAPAYEIGFTGAAAYQYVRYFSVPTGEDRFDHGIGANVGVYSEWDVTEDIDFDIAWSSTIILNDLGQTSHHASVTWAQEIIPDFDFDVSAIYDRVESPPPLEDGTEVKSDDFGLVVGVRLSL